MGSGIGVSLASGVSVKVVGCGEGCGVGVSAEVGAAHAVRMRKIVDVMKSVWLMFKLSAIGDTLVRPVGSGAKVVQPNQLSDKPRSDSLLIDTNLAYRHRRGQVRCMHATKRAQHNAHRCLSSLAGGHGYRSIPITIRSACPHPMVMVYGAMHYIELSLNISRKIIWLTTVHNQYYVKQQLNRPGQSYLKNTRELRVAKGMRGMKLAACRHRAIELIS